MGDVAGMGADLFESYVGSIVGTMVLGAAFMVPGFSVIILMVCRLFCYPWSCGCRYRDVILWYILRKS